MLILTVIVTIGAAVSGYLFYRGVDVHVFAQQYAKYVGMEANLDDRIVYLTSVVGDLFNLAVVPPLCWAVLQLLGLVTIPFKLLFPRILGAKLLVPSQGVPAK